MGYPTEPLAVTVGRARQGVLADHEVFYGAALTKSPFVLLTVSRRVVFGPLPAISRHQAWKLQRWTLINDMAASVPVFMAAVYSPLVLAGVIRSSLGGRNLVVSAGLLALLLVLLHVAGDSVSAHVTGREAGSGQRRDVTSTRG